MCRKAKYCFLLELIFFIANLSAFSDLELNEAFPKRKPHIMGRGRVKPCTFLAI